MEVILLKKCRNYQKYKSSMIKKKQQNNLMTTPCVHPEDGTHSISQRINHIDFSST
jgi:hypothetical protein